MQRTTLWLATLLAFVSLIIPAHAENDTPPGYHQLSTGGFRIPGQARSLEFSADGKQLVIVSDGFASTYDAQSAKTLATLPERGMNNAIFSRDGKFIITAGGNGIVTIWDSATQASMRQIDTKDEIVLHL